MVLEDYAYLTTVQRLIIIQHPIQVDEDVWVVPQTGGTGSASYDPRNFINLQVNASGDYVLMSTKQPMEYQPGKSRLIYMTCVPLAQTVKDKVKVTASIGTFNTDTNVPPNITEGVYFRTDGYHLQWAETTQKGQKIEI